MYECINVWMDEWMWFVWLYKLQMIVRLYNCIWQVNSMKQDKTGKMGGGVTSQYKHPLADFLREDSVF